MRRLALALAALLLVPCLARAQEPVLRWGAAPDSNAPYAFYGAGNQLTGFEYEIVQSLAKRMGRRPVFVQNDWDGLIPGLARDLYDVVICGIEITPEKAAEVRFSDPYYVTYEQLVTQRGAEPVTHLDQLRGRAVGTLSQTAAFAMLSRTPGVDVKPYDEEVNAYRDVASGRLFGVLLDYPIAKYYAAPDPALQLSGPPFGVISYGIALARDDAALAGEVNAALGALIADGELRDILSRWGLWTELTANVLGQPVEPSVPDSAYRAFVAATTAELTLWERISGYRRFAPLLLQGALLTLQVSIAAMLLAIVVGFGLAVLRVFGPRPLRWLAVLYIELVRGTPLLIQLLFLFYGMPSLGVSLTPFAAGVLGLGLNYAAYEAENYRAGLLAVPVGQMEAARALGMTRWQGLSHIVVPQSLRIVLPPVTNDFISLLKDSSLVSMVTLVDLAGAYRQIATQSFDYFGTGLVIAALYLLLGLPFVRLARRTEEQLAVERRRSGRRAAHSPGTASGQVPTPTAHQAVSTRVR